MTRVAQALGVLLCDHCVVDLRSGHSHVGARVRPGPAAAAGEPLAQRGLPVRRRCSSKGRRLLCCVCR